ncbi:cellulose binding domain-containing protein [Streptosporangiaceae bacterium NEAU-GS5]|nr:cellulose binding domain-containing protein [Streptosporangiaceae bacterium NEAU-GS5]
MPTRRLSAAAVTVCLGAFALVGIDPPSAGADVTPVTVTVNAKAGLATVPATALGVNDAVWDTNLGSNQVSDLLKAAGVGTMRYPGGSYGDIYHWETHTAPGGYVAPNTDFDTFINSVHRVGAQAMIIANYGTGTPEEAAGWVRSANVVKGYGVKYWTIGNENYGNGLYGANWEADNHADKSATAYANGVVAFSDAMKAVDPTIKVGAVLTMPANWPDGITAGGDAGNWNKMVLSIAGSKIDFVDVHWYPGGSSAADSLTKSAPIDDALYLLRRQIAQYAPASASRLGISLTETNVGVGQTTQPGALFLADIYSGLLANGVFTINWWNVHNGIGNVSTVAGQTDYNDFGMLSSATCASDGVTCEPALNTPFAPYYGLATMKAFAHTGDQFIRAASDQALVTAHAVRRSNGDVAVLLINKDPDNSYPVTIGYSGYSVSTAAPTVYSYVNGGTAVTTSTTGTATSQTLPPYSLTVVVAHASGSTAGAPSRPGQPTASNVTDRNATISWPAATAGSSPIAKYEVYRQNGAVSEQLGETPGASFTVGNLNPGSRYTVNVLARDNAGKVSWASPPLTITTGAPATSSCTVTFTDANDWGNGYVASIDITNTGTAAIDGWTLTYTWPTVWQSMNGGWNGTWEQTGRNVRVTNADFNAKLAANGGTANIGFVAGYNGPNILPGVFTLNGTVCHT